MKRKTSKKRVKKIVKMASEVIKKATKGYVFDPPTPETIASFEKSFSKHISKILGADATFKIVDPVSMRGKITVKIAATRIEYADEPTKGV